MGVEKLGTSDTSFLNRSGSLTVRVIIQISKQFATPFWAFFAKLGKSPKKAVEIATSLRFGYPMGVGDDKPAFGGDRVLPRTS